MAPVPKFERFSDRLYSGKVNAGPAASDAVKPRDALDFPVHFDPLLGYKEFLS
jgi:hypothetical protein